MVAIDPLVSVILPTRNRRDRLGIALGSVLAQSYRRLEILVVDDASALPAEQVVSQVGKGDPRLRVIRLDARSGAAVARNTAFKEATGEIIAFVDDDDLWKPQKLERHVRYYSDHPHVGIVTSDYEVADERHPDRVVVHRLPIALQPHHLLWFNPIHFSSSTLRRDAVEEELWLDESFPSVEDWDLWVRCTRRTTIGIIREALGRQTLHADGRLSDPVSQLNGLRAFEARHAASLSKACRAFLRAHQRMEMGVGWRKRANVLRSLATDSPRASALLLLEQSVRQVGNMRGDPGLVGRVLVRTITSP